MKNIAYIFTCLLFCVTAASCGKDDPVSNGGDPQPTPTPTANPELEFNVTCENRTYAIGEQVDFTIEGNAHEIQFFSGEAGSRYEFQEEGEKVQVEKVAVSFKSQISNLNDLEASRRRWVKISYDFDGQRQSKTSIEAATWIDITSKFALATSNTAVESGEVDLADYAQEGSFYFAVGMYHSARSDRGSTTAKSPSYRINTFKFYGITEYNETVNFIDGNKLNTSFTAYDFQASDNLGFSSVGTNQLRLQYTDTAEMFGEHEIWMISDLLKCDEIPLPAESGEIIKYSYTQTISEHHHTFTAAGQYKVVFVGIDLVSDEQIVKTMTVTVQ